MTKIIAQRTLIGGALLALVGMTSPASVQADPSADLTPALNEGIAQIGPMLQGEYGSFAETAAHLSDAVGALACGADPEEVRPAFRAAFTAWARVQSVHIGPINSLDRRPRIQFFPDKRNAAPRLLMQALGKADPKLIKPNGLTFASVAVQGFPALERVLYGAAFKDIAQTDYACAFRKAVAVDLAKTAQELADGWADPAANFAPFLDSQAAIGTLLAGMDAWLAETERRRLAGVMGEAPAAARPSVAESPDAGLSRDLLIASLEGTQALHKTALVEALSQANPALADRVDAAFAATIAAAKALPADIASLAQDPEARDQLVALHDQVLALRQVATVQTAETLGVVLGFNSQDGD